MMNIKESIGQRIMEGRKAKGLTRKALAELTDDLKPSRINNWERGIRTPGPEEIKQLAVALDVSPAFLMCLTEQKQQRPIAVLIPVLTHQQACDPIENIQAIKNEGHADEAIFLPVSHELAASTEGNLFALQMKDDSMQPELKMHDTLIIDPHQSPKPGNYVIAKLEGGNDVIVRRYKQLSAINHEYELTAINEVWANIHIDNINKCKIIGTVISFIRKLAM